MKEIVGLTADVLTRLGFELLDSGSLPPDHHALQRGRKRTCSDAFLMVVSGNPGPCVIFLWFFFPICFLSVMCSFG